MIVVWTLAEASPDQTTTVQLTSTNLNQPHQKVVLGED